MMPEILLSRLAFKKNIMKSFIDDYIGLRDKMLCMLNLDDGYKTVLDRGLEDIESLNLPITIFLNT